MRLVPELVQFDETYSKLSKVSRQKSTAQGELLSKKSLRKTKSKTLVRLESRVSFDDNANSQAIFSQRTPKHTGVASQRQQGAWKSSSRRNLAESLLVSVDQSHSTRNNRKTDNYGHLKRNNEYSSYDFSTYRRPKYETKVIEHESEINKFDYFWNG